jgi:DNA recombination protein RmuC
MELILMLLLGLTLGLIGGFLYSKSQYAKQLEQQLQLIKSEMFSASERILKERARELSDSNEQQLSNILNPLKENIRQMKDAVEKSDRAQTVTMERLDASIKENLKQAQEVGERADKLAQALTSDNKTQGNFGELRLKQLLEEMGLEEGVQFEEQATLRDDQGRTIYEEDGGHRMITDVILHFSDQRDVIIDSNMSFTAFQDYFNADTDDERESALRRHLMSVRQHVNELSKKNYSRYIREGRQRLDFVMMYVFSESALQLALSNDPGLWKEAYDKGVIIAGSQSLYIMLRVLEMTWKQVRQVENQQEIMKTASLIVERVQLFYERFLKVDEQLHKTGEAFEDLKRSTASSGQSITTAAAKLLKYGAQENPKRKQRLPSSQLPESDGCSGSDVE